MGCWNETCYMSNLPINWGDKIALIVLGPTSHQRLYETCYPEDNYVPLGFPIIGEYDDYGGIEKVVVDSYMNQYLQTFEKLYQVKRDDDDNRVFVEYHWEKIDDFLRDLCTHSLYVDATVNPKEKQPLEFVMIHYELYQRLLSDMANRLPYGESDTLQVLLKGKVLSAIQKLKTDYDFYKTENVPQEFLSVFCRFSEKCKYTNDYRWRSLDKFVDYYLNSPDGSIIDCIVNNMIWYRVMSYSRKGYHCYSGGGSQSQEYQLHRVIANFILEKCEERRHDEDAGYQPESVLAETIFF